MRSIQTQLHSSKRLIILIVLLALAAAGQQPTTTPATDPAAQADALITKGNELFTAEKYEEAIRAYQQAIPLYRKLGKTADIGRCHLNIAGALQNLKQFQRAIDANLAALPFTIKAGDRDTQAKALLRIGENYQYLANYKRSTEYLEQAYVIFQELDDVFFQAYAQFDIGHNYLRLTEYERSAGYYTRSLAGYRHLKDARNEAAALANLGLIYATLRLPDQATEYLRQAITVVRDVDDAALRANILLMAANAYSTAGRYQDSLAQYEAAFKVANELGNHDLELQSLSGVGTSQSELGDYEKALVTQQAALKLATEVKDDLSRSYAYGNLGLVYMELGKYGLSFEYNEKALMIARQLKDKNVERTMLNNFGVAYLRLGSLAKAAEYIHKAVDISRRIKDRRSLALGIANLGAAYTRLKQYDKAIAFFDEAAPLLREFREYRFIVIAAYYHGTLRRERGEIDKAIALHTEAIDVARVAHTPKFEARAQIELGLDYLARNHTSEASKNFQDALIRAREVKAPEEESAALDGLMRSYDRSARRTLAIFYGKQSINLLQAIRGDITQFGKDVQTNYVKDNEQTYRRLAEALVSEGRIPEAQQVLAMLKEEELTGFVRRDAKEIEALSKRADLRATERSALERYNLLSSRVASLGVELTALESKKRASGDTFAEQARLDELSAQIKDANAAFRVFLEKELAAELGTEKKKEIEADRALQGKLRQWGEGTVALATIVGEDRYRVIVTTPNVQIDGKSEIKAADLNQKIFAFRKALLNPLVDPRPLGKELYDILVAPVEKDLTAAGAKTLLWSLDGTLRYIPVAALWDGQQYLVQKYQNVIVTSTTRQSLLADVSNDWRVLGGGVTKASQVTDANTAEKYTFDELQGVTRELSEVISVERIPGISLLDAAFTTDALKQQLGRTVDNKRKFNAIHFATHFRLGSDTADSFLLLGNNKALSLAEISDSPEIDLTDVELVTLSACNTGFGGIESKESLTQNNGKEVDSLAQFIEMRGAKAVMATLWSVVDDSTALLMGQFYRLHKDNPGWTKSESMRAAQLALLNGEIKGTPAKPAKGKRSDPIALDDVGSAMPPFASDPKKPFAHPHYWAPFILIGNWR